VRVANLTSFSSSVILAKSADARCFGGSALSDHGPSIRAVAIVAERRAAVNMVLLLFWF
jgi:hypothetical protein